MRRLARSARWLATTTGGLGPLESARASERLTTCQSTLLQSLGHLLRPSPDAAGCASATLLQPALGAETLSERYSQTSWVTEIRSASQESSHSNVQSWEEGQPACSTPCQSETRTPCSPGLSHTTWASQGATRHGLGNLSNNVHSIHPVLPQHGSLRPLSSYPAAAAAAVTATAEGSSSSSSTSGGAPAPKRGRTRSLEDLDLLPPRSRRLQAPVAAAAPGPAPAAAAPPPSAAAAAALAASQQPSLSATPGTDQPASPGFGTRGSPGPAFESTDSERVPDALDAQVQSWRTSAMPSAPPAPPLRSGAEQSQACTRHPQTSEPWERPWQWARALPSAAATAPAAVPAAAAAPATTFPAATPSPTPRAHLVDIRPEDLSYGSFRELIHALKCGAAPPLPKELLGLALKVGGCELGATGSHGVRRGGLVCDAYRYQPHQNVLDKTLRRRMISAALGRLPSRSNPSLPPLLARNSG